MEPDPTPEPTILLSRLDEAEAIARGMREAWRFLAGSGVAAEVPADDDDSCPPVSPRVAGGKPALSGFLPGDIRLPAAARR